LREFSDALSSADRIESEGGPIVFSHPDRSGKLLERGVHVVPALGEDGEMILIAVDHRHRLIGRPIFVRPGDSHLAASDALWERIERKDPFYLEAI
jgi:hypothetical protein